MTTPTDAELQEAYDSVPAHGDQQVVHIAGLRAVLAKWGNPAPVGVEPVAYRHMHDDGWEYYDAPTGDDCPGCQALYTREQVLAMGRAEMTSDERLEGVKRAARNVTRGGKEAAIAFLKRAGIMGEDGKIKPEFAADDIKQGGQHD